MDNDEHAMHDHGLGPLTWRNYVPLALVFAFIIAATVLWGWSAEHFMAVFFLVFAAFKFTNLRGFADGYADYDLLAMHWRAYGFLYPFIELGFGITLAVGYAPAWLLWTEFAVMAFSGIGVVRKLLRHEQVKCVCLGTWLKVPLTVVTLFEDFGMAALAAYLVLR